MVLSASSVRSYVIYDDSYAVVKRQLMWVVLGLPAAWVASRLPIRHIRRLAYPGFLVALVLLGLVAKFGVADQRQQELARPRPGQHPARGDRQARDRAVGRQHLRPQGAPAARAPPPAGARGARPVRRHRAGPRRPRPRHRHGARRDPARHALGGRRPDAALRAQPLGPRRRRGRARGHRPRAAQPHHPLHRPVQGLHRRRLAARPRALRAVERRLVRPGHRRLHPEVGRPARGPHRLHLRRARRGARPGRHAAGGRPLLHHRLRRRSGSRSAPRTRSSATPPSASSSGCSAR